MEPELLPKAERIALSSVDSTNLEAFRRAPSLRGPLWVLADVQTAGRGRRARAWVSPVGNFYGSYIDSYDGQAPADLGLRSFVAALALYDSFETLLGGGGGLALKWPNDVLLNGGKLTGILLEAKLPHLVIGIGVNLVSAPPPVQLEAGAVAPVSLLAETGIRLQPGEFLEHLAPAMARREAQFRAMGFGAIRADWLARAARIGETITARTMRTTLTGRFETVDLEGNLILHSPDGRHAISAADVFF